MGILPLALFSWYMFAVLLNNLSPVPKSSAGKTTTRKRESAAVVTSSPYKDDLLKRWIEKPKAKRSTSKQSNQQKPSTAITYMKRERRMIIRIGLVWYVQRRTVFVDLRTFGYNARCVIYGLMNYTLKGYLNSSFPMASKIFLVRFNDSWVRIYMKL